MKTKKYFILPVLLFVSFIFLSCEKYKSSDQENIKTTENYGTEGTQKNLKHDEAPTTTEKSSNSKDAPETKKTSSNNSGDNLNNEKVLDKRMIIKTGTINIEVDNFSETEKLLLDVVAKYNANVANSNIIQNAAGKKQGAITVQVPSDKYEALLKEISVIGKVASQTTKSSDVTEEYIDLEARLKTQKELEQRMIKLLQENARSLSDIIVLEDKLASIRKNIESIEGKMRLLKNQSDLSTLTINIYEPSILQTSTGGGFFDELWDSIKSGMRGFTKILGGIFTLLIAFTPIIILLIVVYIIIRKIVKKRKAKSGI